MLILSACRGCTASIRTTRCVRGIPVGLHNTPDRDFPPAHSGLIVSSLHLACSLFRNSGLSLLSKMATLFPAQMASRLRTLLDEVCAAAASTESFSGGGGSARAALRQTQKAVQSVVPALKAHGAEAGVGAHFVVQVRCDFFSRVGRSALCAHI